MFFSKRFLVSSLASTSNKEINAPTSHDFVASITEFEFFEEARIALFLLLIVLFAIEFAVFEIKLPFGHRSFILCWIGFILD